MTSRAAAFHSEIDERHQVPGSERPLLAAALAAESAALPQPSFETAGWARVAELDAREGLGTRRAARALLRRACDGRFLLFRYPFRDGTARFIIPGGGAEAGEDPVAAVAREVLEETGTLPRALQFSGLVLFHLLASTLYDGHTPTVQYSPVLLGEVDDELPDTGGREALWFTIDEFEAQPRRPVSQPLVQVLRVRERGDRLAPQAVWLPA